MSKKSLMAVAVVAALSTGLVASGTTPVFAADNQAKQAVPKDKEAVPKDEEQAAEAADKDFIKVSDDALTTMRNVGGARLAIFNGQPDKAQTYVDAAVARVATTVKDGEKYALDTEQPMSDDMYVPFDAALTVAETFVPSAEKMKHIARANEHLHKGKRKEAIEVLKLGEVDVAVAAKLVPVKFAKSQIEEAAKPIGEGKYYEANLALKAVEDAIVVESYAIDAVPEVKAKG